MKEEDAKPRSPQSRATESIVSQPPPFQAPLLLPPTTTSIKASPASALASSPSTSQTTSWKRLGAILLIGFFGGYIIRGDMELAIHNDPVLRDPEITVKPVIDHSGQSAQLSSNSPTTIAGTNYTVKEMSAGSSIKSANSVTSNVSSSGIFTSSLDLTTDGENRKGHLLNKSSSSELSFLKKRNDIERKNITLSMKEGSLRSNAKKSSDHKKQGGHPHGRAHQHGHSHQYGHSVIGDALPGAAGKNLKKSATKLRVHAARFNGSDVLSGSSGHGSGGHHRHKSGGDRVAQEIVASSFSSATKPVASGEVDRLKALLDRANNLESYIKKMEAALDQSNHTRLARATKTLETTTEVSDSDVARLEENKNASAGTLSGSFDESSRPAPHEGFSSGVTFEDGHEHSHLGESTGQSRDDVKVTWQKSVEPISTRINPEPKQHMLASPLSKSSGPWRDYTETLTKRTNLEGAHAHSDVHMLDGLSITWDPDQNATDWLAVLKNTKYDIKSQCSFPPSEDSAPLKPPFRLSSRHVNGPRAAWFFTLNYGPSQAYKDMVKSLVLSGRMKAPNLEPFFLYVLTPQQYKIYERNGKKPDELEKWMAGLGVAVIIHVVSFAERPGMQKEVHAQWARIDLLPLIRDLREDFKKQGLLTSHVLYTDMDIFFAKAPPLPGTSAYGPLNDCGEAHPKGAKKKVAGSHCPWGGHGNPIKDPNWPYIFGAGTEVFSGWGLNSGVMYINIENSSKYFAPLVEHCAKVKQFNHWPAADQSCLEDFFSSPNDAVGWDWLDDSVINSRGFLDPNRFLTGQQGSTSRSAIWHWHGYKANQIQCIFNAIKEGSWTLDNGPNFSTRRGGLNNPTDKGPLAKNVPGCRIIQGRFKFTLYGCYLSTYAWMLIQHERWLHIAKTARFVHD